MLGKLFVSFEGKYFIYKQFMGVSDSVLSEELSNISFLGGGVCDYVTFVSMRLMQFLIC